jgi:hypothetical protein
LVATDRMTTNRNAVPWLALVVLTLAAAACDPGWSYTVPDGRRVPIRVGTYEIDDLYARVFTDTLGVRVTIRNLANEPLRGDPGLMRITDALGRAIPRYPRGGGDHAAVDEVIVLHKGERGELKASFVVVPMSHPFWRNRDLRAVTLTLDGLGGAPFQTKLDWE